MTIAPTPPAPVARRWVVPAMLLLVAGSAAAQCRYEVTLVPEPPCSLAPTVVVATAINDGGTVAGYYYQCIDDSRTHAFRWHPSTGFETLVLPFATISEQATDINDHGHIVGYFSTGTQTRSFVWFGDDNWHELLPLPGTPWCHANAINNSGVVVGSRTIEPGNTYLSAFTWSVEDGFTDLGVFGGPNAALLDISHDGFVGGYSGNNVLNCLGLIGAPNDVVELGPMQGGTTSWIQDVMREDFAVGTGRVDVPTGPRLHALRYDGRTLMDLGTLPGYWMSTARAAHPNGLIVGNSGWPDGDTGVTTAVIWHPSGIVRLDDLVEDDEKLEFNVVVGINASGQMIVTGSQAGHAASFVTSPVSATCGDLDGNGATDVADLNLLLESWGTPGPGDFDCDLRVGPRDLAFLLADWS